MVGTLPDLILGKKEPVKYTNPGNPHSNSSDTGMFSSKYTGGFGGSHQHSDHQDL
jgi:hypothetical protein